MTSIDDLDFRKRADRLDVYGPGTKIPKAAMGIIRQLFYHKA